MKIAMLSTTLYSQGAEYVTAAMARGLYARGHAIDVIVSAVHTDLERTCTDRDPFTLSPGIRLIRLPHRHARQNIVPLLKYMRANRPDAVLCNANSYLGPLVVASWLGSRKTKVINVEHSGGIGVDEQGNVSKPKVRCLRARLQSLAMRFADAVFTVSEGTRLAIHRVSGYPLEKIYTVYNPAIDEVTDAKLRLSPKHPWLIEKSCPVFVAAGALTGFKNFGLLIKAFAVVHAKVDCRLIIFGEGPCREELESMIQEMGLAKDVSLPGYTNQLPAELKAADVFVVSSNVESFSVVLIEAIAAGVNIISTDAPYGPPEILENGKYGRMVKRDNVDELAAAMIEVVKEKNVVVPIAKANMFRIGSIVKRYEAALREVVGNVR